MSYQKDRIIGIPSPLPADYDRQANFTDYEIQNPGEPPRGPDLDAEFNAVEQALDETQARLRLIQRDDGAVANSSIGLDQLKNEARIGVNTPSEWGPFTQFQVNDSVIDPDGAWYVAQVSHVSSDDFEADLAQGQWRQLIDLVPFTTEARNWATRAEDDPVPEGDGTEFSARHHALKAAKARASMLGSEYEFIGDYVAGMELIAYNQLVRDSNGEFWRVSGTTELPYTTTGDGLPEGGAFVAVGDAVIRNDLAAGVGAGKGALLVRGSVLYVDTIADLQALPTSELVDGQQVQVKEYHAGTGVGGGEFYRDASSTEEENSVTIFGGHTQGRWKRNQELFNVFYVDWAGAVPNDQARAVENYHAIRKCQEVAINEVGRLGVAVEANNGKCKIVLGAGIYYVQGNSVFAFSNEELQGFGYYTTSRRRTGVHWEGQGRQVSHVQLVNDGAETWLYDSRNPSDGNTSGVYDYVTFSNMTLQGETNTPAGRRRHRVPESQKINGFYMETYGMEKFITFENVHFTGFDKLFVFTGYGNADHNQWIGCSISRIRDFVFYFNNGESVANRIISSDMESIYGDVFRIGPDGGGDITYIGGSVILQPLYGENDLPDPVASASERRAFFRVDNTFPRGVGTLSPSNAMYLFKKLRFENYDDYQAIVYAEYGENGTNVGSFSASFEQCQFLINNRRDPEDDTIESAPSTEAKTLTLVDGHRGVIRYTECAHGPRERHIIQNVGRKTGTLGHGGTVIHFTRPYLSFFFSDTGFDGLKERCSIIPGGPDNVCNAAIYASDVSVLSIVNNNGAWTRRNAMDFEMASGKHVGSGRVKSAHLKNTEQDWANLGGAENRLYIPTGSIVTGFTIYKPGTSQGGGDTNYSLRIGTYGESIVWNSGAGDEERTIVESVALENPIVTSSNASESYFYIYKVNGSLESLGNGGQVILHYL